MSKHFFYDYRGDLQEQLQKLFRRQLNELEHERNRQAQLDVAHNIIEKYFSDLENSLADIIVVSNGRIQVIRDESMIVQFKMFDNYVKFTRFEHAIEVEIGEYDEMTQIVEARINSNIIPSEKKCVVKKIGKVHDGSHFDENTIHYYMNEAFSNLKELSE